MLHDRECEHQELFHFNVDLTKTIDIHIPSPLGAMSYYLFVLVPEGEAARLGNVSARFDLIGLRESHLDMAPGENAIDPCAVPSRIPGKVWYNLGRAQLARGDGPMTLHGWPLDLTNVDLLICAWPRFVTAGYADDWIAAQDDPNWAPSGVPLGGIGAGRVEICRDGRFRSFSMNNNQDSPFEPPLGLPGAYLAVEAEGKIVDIATRPVEKGHQACSALEYDLRFPQASLAAKDALPGIDVQVLLSSAHVPQDLKWASLPGFIVRWTLSNTGASAKQVSVRMGWPNLVGMGGGVTDKGSPSDNVIGTYIYWEDPTGRAETQVETGGCTAVRYTGTPAEQFIASAGEHLLGVAKAPGVATAATCGGGNGEVTATIMVPAGGSAEVTMALVAAMPHWMDSLHTDRGQYWQNFYSSADEMLAALCSNAEDILAQTGALAAHLVDGTLPGWLSRRLSNCNYPLVTNSVLYKDGRFSINEGPNEMTGVYGTIDQRLAAHPATQLFFPQLNDMELSLFAAIQGSNGGICHDLGSGNLERGPGENAWPDLTCSFIIQTARHAWSTGDTDFERKMWAHAKRALYRHGRWADEGKGVAQVGKGLGTSYDSYHYIGTTAYIGTLWLAALAICEKWAARMGDESVTADITRWRTAAIERLDADLWNGKYFIAYGDTEGGRRDTCHAGQLAGQVYTRLLCGQNVLDEAKVASCAEALFEINGNETFYLPPDEATEGGETGALYSWVPYVEGFMMSALASLGDARFWRLWSRIIDAVEREGLHPCDTRLMYRPLSGAQSWGNYYMTAPASWLVYDAMLNFFYEPGEGVLRLGALAPGRYPLVHPLFWATAEVASDGATTLTVKRLFTDRPLLLKAVESPAARVPAGKPGVDELVRRELGEAVALKAGVTVRL